MIAMVIITVAPDTGMGDRATATLAMAVMVTPVMAGTVTPVMAGTVTPVMVVTDTPVGMVIPVGMATVHPVEQLRWSNSGKAGPPPTKGASRMY